MGRNKMLMSFKGQPMVLHIADALTEAGLPPPIVVLGDAADAVAGLFSARPHMPVRASDYRLGLAHSLRAGVQHIPPAWDAAFICLGDMPLISAGLLREMAERADPETIIIPHFAGQRGNPVLWGRRFFAALSQLEGDSGGRQILDAEVDAVKVFAWADASVLTDFDTVDDVAAHHPT
jgi:molybdenum cofactor cytidylyltransferase